MNNRTLGTSNPVRRLSGEADIDVSAAVYTSPVNLIEIACGGTHSIEDVYIVFDLAKATTGFGAGYTSETIQFFIARKIDGTNWRVLGGPNEFTATMTGTVAGTTRGMGLRIGTIHPTEDCRIYVTVSTEQGDAELPYVIYYKGRTPTITAVAA